MFAIDFCEQKIFFGSMKYNYYPSSAMNTWLKGVQHLLSLLVLFSVC
jgi:hypothetical protein